MSEKIYNILFLCTGNSARSIMAETILNANGNGRFKAYSAGSHPSGTVNPYALEQLQLIDCPVRGLRSKSWEEFATPDAPHMDFVITVCDNAAGETCPAWPGEPVTAHWSFMDPSGAKGTHDEIHHVFAKVCREIKTRIDLFLSLPIAKLEKLALQRELDRIGSARSPSP